MGIDNLILTDRDGRVQSLLERGRAGAAAVSMSQRAIEDGELPVMQAGGLPAISRR
jgi:hypothetical protein